MQSYSPQSMPPPQGANIKSIPPGVYPNTSTGTADYLEQLPTDSETPTHEEIQVVDTIFKKETTTMQKICTALTRVND